MDIRLSGHGAYRTEYHIVWIPKYRRRILNPGVRGYLVKLLPKVLETMPGCEMIESSIQIDHIWLKKVYWKEDIVWSPGYFVSTVGVDEEKVLKYVRWQERQDSGQAKLELF